MKKIIVSSNKKELTNILNFINKGLNSFDPSPKFCMQLELSIEEIFINIVDYAFLNNSNKNKITIEYNIEKDINFKNNIDSENNSNSEKNLNHKKNPSKVVVKFVDGGIPYNPLKNENPNISLSSDERDIGGLGILLVKKNVDNIDYKYKNKKNILTIKKMIK